MNIFKHRPLSQFCAVFIAFFALFASSSWLDEGIFAVFFIFLSLCLLVTFFFIKVNRKWILLAIAFLLFALLGILYSYFVCDASLERAEAKYADKECTVMGYVLDEASINSYSSSYYVQVQKIDGKSVDFKARIDLDFVDYLDVGQGFELLAVGARFEDDLLGYPERKMMFSEGYSLAFESCEETISILEGTVKSPRMFFERLNSKLCAKVSYRMPNVSGELVNSLLLGNRDGLNERVQRDFSRSGVSHLLALSGLHTGIIIGFLDLLLKKLRCPKYPRVIAVVLFAFVYLALTGFAASTMRAVLMMTLVYLALVLGTGADAFTSLFVSCTIILLIFPYSVFDAGFWMSFAATFGIIVFSPLLIRTIRNLIGKMRVHAVISKTIFAVLSSLAVSVCAIAFIVLCSMLYFGEISPISPITTLILSPITVLYLVLSLATIIFMRVPIIFTVVKFMLGLLSKLYIAITSYFSEFSGAVVSLGYGFAVFLVTIATLLLIVFAAIKLKRKWIIALVPLGFVACFALGLGVHGAVNSQKLSIDYMKYSKSESIVIRDDDQAIICDFSDGSYSSLRSAANAVSDGCITEIEAIVLTHYHKKHSYSVRKLIDSSMVRSVWLPTPQNESDYYVFSSLYDIANDAGVNISVYDYGTPLTIFTSATLTFNKDYISRSTHPVLSMRFESESNTVTYLGSSINELKNSAEIFNSARHSNTLILGQHGPIVKRSYEIGELGGECDRVLVASEDMLEKIEILEASKVKIVRKTEKISVSKR